MQKALFIRTHYSKTIKNGANQYCEWVNEILQSSFDVDTLDLDSLTLNDSKNQSQLPSVHLPSQRLSALFSLAFDTNYYSQRLVPFRLRNLNFKYKNYKLIVISFVHCYKFFERELSSLSIPVIILTHNYDPHVFEQLKSKGLLYKIISQKSYKNYKKTLNAIPSNVYLASISEEDIMLYSSFSNASSLLIEPPIPLPTIPKESKNEKVNLVFVGSLNTPFNINSLEYFSSTISPVLKTRINFTLHVIGSSPTQVVKELAQNNDWILHANLSDVELDFWLSKMTAGIMPFPYSYGFKIKAFRYLSSGLPVLATTCVAAPNGFEDVFLSSDDFNVWASFCIDAKLEKFNSLQIQKNIKFHRQIYINSIKEKINKILADY